MDNAQEYTATYTRWITNSSKLKVKFLPPYRSELALVEHAFRAIKTKMKSRSLELAVDLSKISGIKIIENWLESILKTLKSSRSKVVEECCEEIKEIVNELGNKHIQKMINLKVKIGLGHHWIIKILKIYNSYFNH